MNTLDTIKVIQTYNVPKEGLSDINKSNTLQNTGSNSALIGSTGADRLMGLPTSQGFACNPFKPQDNSIQTMLGSMAQAVISPFLQIINQLFGVIGEMMQMLKDAKATPAEPAKEAPTTPGTQEPTDETASPGGNSTIDKNIKNLSRAPSGFLWKPESDKDGKLAILTPKNLANKVKSVKILDGKTQQVIESGKWAGIGNGDRAHFRFKHPGSHYKEGSIVEMQLDNGKSVRTTIKNPARRLEGK